jgi:hypothetical protein
MARLSRQLADVLAIDPLGRPDVFVLIHLEQLLTSLLNIKKIDILTEDVSLRVINFR